MATTVSGRVPLRILRRGDQGYQHYTDMVGQRFMGTLLAPVPRREMARRCGLDQAGSKLVVSWPGGCEDAHPVQSGDRVEIEGQTFTICGVDERAGCYLDLYIAPV